MPLKEAICIICVISLSLGLLYIAGSFFESDKQHQIAAQQAADEDWYLEQVAKRY